MIIQVKECYHFSFALETDLGGTDTGRHQNCLCGCSDASKKPHISESTLLKQTVKNASPVPVSAIRESNFIGFEPAVSQKLVLIDSQQMRIPEKLLYKLLAVTFHVSSFCQEISHDDIRLISPSCLLVSSIRSTLQNFKSQNLFLCFLFFGFLVFFTQVYTTNFPFSGLITVSIYSINCC